MAADVPPPPAPRRKLADRTVRRRHAAIAGHTGDVDSARRLFDDVDPGVRATALGALARARALRSSELARAAADPDAGVRRRAAEVMASSQTADATLLPLLEDPEAVVVETAAWAAGERWSRTVEAGGDPVEPVVVPVLIGIAVGHRDALCREAAVAALGAIGDERGLAAILSATTDKATVRRRAVLALAPFGGPDVDAALERARTDRDWQVRQAAEDLTLPTDDTDDL
jgi:HEAT repeat protein